MAQKKKVKKSAKKIPEKREPIEGVSYIRIDNGASCPICRMSKAHVTHTLSWESSLRVRYHLCRRCGTRFKSIEED